MSSEIIINADPGETRVAILEKSQFTEFHIERDAGKSVVGNVVKGRVSRVLPGMQAAFVDIGLDKAAFLYVGDYFDNSPGGDEPPSRRRRGHRAPPKIDTVLREGQEIVVQIAKEPIGSKGARIKSHISIPGRHLVLTPWERRVGVSRRIDSDKERRRLKEIVSRLRPKEVGFIIRTAGDGVREADIEADIRYLTSIWEKIQAKHDTEAAPCVLHEEPDLSLKVIRDFAGPETKRVVTDSPAAFEQINDFIERFVADPKPRVEHYQGPKPLFDAMDLEHQIQANLERKVWLKSGGHLVIDQSEALTAIDVNTGRFTGKRDLEETVLKTNLEAVKEVVYQLRFRNIGGLIIIDLIDMESNANREKVYRALQEAIRADKARTNILKISELGLVEMTRKRTRENLVQTLCEPCAYCEGRGYVMSRESVAYRVLREIRTDLPHISGRRVAVSVHPQVAEALLRDHASLTALGETLGREIEVRARPGIHQEQFEVTALDEGPALDLSVRWLRDADEIAREEQEEKDRKAAEKREAREARETRKREGRGNGRRRRGRGRSEEDEDEAAEREAGEGSAPEAVAEGAAAQAAPDEAAAAGSDEAVAASDGATAPSDTAATPLDETAAGASDGVSAGAVEEAAEAGADGAGADENAGRSSRAEEDGISDAPTAAAEAVAGATEQTSADGAAEQAAANATGATAASAPRAAADDEGGADGSNGAARETIRAKARPKPAGDAPEAVAADGADASPAPTPDGAEGEPEGEPDKPRRKSAARRRSRSRAKPSAPAPSEAPPVAHETLSAMDLPPWEDDEGPDDKEKAGRSGRSRT